MSHWIDRLSSPLLRESLRLMRVDRPIGTWLVLWPSLWALTAAAKPGYPEGRLVLVFVLGSFLMRSAGCVINDLADRGFDPLVARTRDRPLAAKRISAHAAKRLLAGLLALAFLLALQLNFLAIQLSVVAAFLAISYPYTKRFIHVPQFYLGAAFGWGVMVAWGAVAQTLPWEAWLLFAATLTWAAAYDTLYAMMDREDDRRIGLNSTALFFGRWCIPAVAFLYLMTLGFLAMAGWRLHFSILFHGVLLAAGGQMAWQIIITRHDRSDACLRAFISNKWLGLMVWVGFVVG